MMLDHVCQGPVILIASSLGAWVSFLDLLNDVCNSFEITHVRDVSVLAECINHMIYILLNFSDLNYYSPTKTSPNSFHAVYRSRVQCLTNGLLVRIVFAG